MTANQYASAIEKLGLNQVTASRFLGISIRTSHGYANGETPVPEAIGKLLRLMIRLELNPTEVR
jgi:hypothetical protein